MGSNSGIRALSPADQLKSATSRNSTAMVRPRDVMYGILVVAAATAIGGYPTGAKDVINYDGDKVFVDNYIFHDDDSNGCDDGAHGDDGGGDGGEEGCGGCYQNVAQTANDPTTAAPHEQQHGPAPPGSPKSHQLMPAYPVCPEPRWIRIHLCYDCKDGQGAYELSLK